MRKFRFTFEIECATIGTADLNKVEELIDLTMQELCYDEEFIQALDEKQAVTIQVLPQFGKTNG